MTDRDQPDGTPAGPRMGEDARMGEDDGGDAGDAARPADAESRAGGWREARPPTLPIFPLPGVLLLPGGKLPLNIFEPRYLQMTEDAMACHRMIGMVQPTEASRHASKPEPYGVGCAGRITSFSETGDGRYLITLTGATRFRIVEELAVTTGYRQVVASYDDFAADAEPPDAKAMDGERLLTALRAYLAATGIPADWDSINRAPLPTLVTSLAMICPFSPGEKQALLEAPDAAERARTLTALMEMAAIGAAGRHDDSGEPPKPN